MAQARTHIAPTETGDRFLLHLLAVFAGMGLLLSSAGIWVLASSALSIWVKMAVSIALLTFGAMALAPRRAPRAVGHAPLIIEIDAEARELHIVEHMRDSTCEVSARHDFDGLGRMDLRDHSFVAFDRAGRLLVQVPLHDRVAERRLRDSLRAVQA